MYENIFEVDEQENDICANLNLSSAGGIEGRTVAVSSGDGYRRSVIRKIYDCIRYKQSFDDHINTIIVRTNNTEQRDYHILLYGQLPGGVAEITVGSQICAYGTLDKSNHFFAKYIICDGVKIIPQNRKKSVLFFIGLIALFFAGLKAIDGDWFGSFKEHFLLFISLSLAGTVWINGFIKRKRRILHHDIHRWKRIWGILALFTIIFLILI